jgi:hypothetical protein
MAVAIAVYEYFGNHGYHVRSEKSDPAAPFTPTFTATRASTTLHLDVCGTFVASRVREWVAFAKSTGSDTRVGLCMPEALAPAQEGELRHNGVGLYLMGLSGIREAIAPVDLALSLALPPIGSLSRKCKELLGPAYEKFQKGEWREGFEEACNAFEEEARRYLKRWSGTGRIKVSAKSLPTQLTAKEVNALTMGGLRDKFRKILSPTLLDSTIAEALERINPDRIERVHRRRAKRTETRLRKNVGKHIWLIVNVMKKMCE